MGPPLTAALNFCSIPLRGVGPLFQFQLRIDHELFPPVVIIRDKRGQALGAAGRVAALVRNAGLRPKSTLQTAIGIKHPKIVQKSMGFLGGSFNTREFFHGRGRPFLRSVKWVALAGGFALPAVLLAAVLAGAAPVVAIC